jgi:pimeloyl-ACP methyl ester carboxylesterase
VSRLIVCNAPQPWPRLSWGFLAGLPRAWYVLVLAAPLLGPWLIAEERFLAWLLSLGRRPVPRRAEVRGYAARLAEPARARASSLLYRAYLRLGAAALIGRRYDRMRLSVPTRMLFGREDAYIPLAYLDGLEARGDDITVERVPDCGHWTPEERPELIAERARELFGSGSGATAGSG